MVSFNQILSLEKENQNAKNMTSLTFTALVEKSNPSTLGAATATEEK